jgi:hypothetical protein
MKKLLILLFSLFFLSSPSVFADDISYFTIEGIGIGDSLLDYMTEDEILEEIEKSKDWFYYLKEPKKYSSVTLRKEFPLYNKGISFIVKNNSANQYIGNKNEKYKILMIRGLIDYDEDFEGCVQKRDEIAEVVSKMFSDAKKVETVFKHGLDPSGNSIVNSITLEFDSGDEANFDCSNWEENFKIKNNFYNGLSVVINSEEIVNWSSNYK